MSETLEQEAPTVSEQPEQETRDIPQQLQRTEVVRFTRAEGQANERVYTFPFSSETPVQRAFGNEVLSHEGEAVNLSRMNDGAPLLFNHDPNKVIGVVERSWVEGQRGYATVRFSRNAFAQEVMGDVQDGILRGVSVGYSIDAMKEIGRAHV